MSVKQSIDNIEQYVTNLEDQLSHALQELEGVYDFVEKYPNNMELGEKVREYYYQNTEEMEDDPIYVYESPDGGETLYRREIGEVAREKIENDKQVEMFDEE